MVWSIAIMAVYGYMPIWLWRGMAVYGYMGGIRFYGCI